MLLCIMLTVTCFAEGHLSFKGVEMNKTLNGFKNELVKQGYTVVETGEEGIALKGKFAGFSDCVIIVLVTPVDKKVHCVTVLLPEQDSWYSLKSRYEDFKSSFTKKYGSPDYDKHIFISPYYEGDGYEMQALNKNKCIYGATYLQSTGEITIMITGEGYSEGRVSIVYKDKINSELNEKATKNTISDDI